MKRLSTRERTKYLEIFPLSDIFSIDMTPYAELLLYEAEELLLDEGEEPTFFYYLIQGRVKVLATQENGTVTLINFSEAPHFIGELEFLESQRYARGVKAVTNCVCYRIRHEECRNALLNDPLFLRTLCVHLGNEAYRNTVHFIRNQSFPLAKRLAEFILLTENKGYYRERHTETAEYLGVTYRHLLYVLADFVNEGYLEKTPQGYWVSNQKALEKLSDSLTDLENRLP